MAGISDKALPVVPNNYLFNGKELQQNKFSDGTSLDDYDLAYRQAGMDLVDMTLSLEGLLNKTR